MSREVKHAARQVKYGTRQETSMRMRDKYAYAETYTPEACYQSRQVNP